MNKFLIFLFSFIFLSGAFASATRIIDADTIKSSDHTKTFTVPANSQIPMAGQIVRDSFSGNSSTTAFTLSFTPPSVTTQVEVYLNGILQIYTTDYTISGTTLTFVTAPTTGQDIKAIYNKF